MEVFPIRTEPHRTWEVWSDSVLQDRVIPERLGRLMTSFAVVEFEDGRIVCMSHDTDCVHVAAVRRFASNEEPRA